jgi:hypothetical protein
MDFVAASFITKLITIASIMHFATAKEKDFIATSPEEFKQT